MSLPCASSPVASTSTANQDSTTTTTTATTSDSSNSKEPQPGPSYSDDPKPGPSTTAAEFDLEVFDSGSSCSLEDAWGLGCSPEEAITQKSNFKTSSCSSATGSLRNRRKTRRTSRGDKKKTISSDSLVGFFTSSNLADFDNSSEDNGDGEEDMSLPSCPFDPAPISMCPSETEEAASASDHEDDLEEDDPDDLDDQDEVDEQDNQEEEEEEECTCGEGPLASCWKCVPSTSAASTTTPAAVASSAVTDPEFVVDSSTVPRSSSKISTHVPPVAVVAAAVAGENIDEIVQDHDNFGTDENEDSLDSLALASGSVSISLYRPDSEDSIEDESSLFGGAKRKNLDETDRVSDSEPIVKKKKKTSQGSANCFELHWNGDKQQQQQQQQHEKSSQNEASKSTSGCPTLAELQQQLLQHQQQQQQQLFMAGDHNLEHEVCSPQPAVPVNCSTPTCSKAFLEDEESEQLPPPSAAVVSWIETFSRWSHCDKIVAIDQLISACHPTQVRHMMTVIEPQFQRDFISLLPKELALYVLSFLEPRDLLRAAQTCRYWRVLAEDNLLWREKCREAGLPDVLETLNIRRKKMSPTGFSYSTWKSGYMRQHNIEMNWRVLPVRAPRVLKGHDDHVITCLQFSGNRIVSGSDDNTLKVWNAITGKCLKTLVGHTGGVWSSQMEGNIIVSGSTDRTLKVWNADTGSCVHTLYGHTSTVRCMHLHDNRVVSGSRDATLRMWDISTGECLHVLMGHVAAVRCVQYDGRLVVSGAYDYMVKVWNPETEECLHTLSGHTNRVYSLQFDGIHVVSGSLDTSIRVWDVETGACKHALMGHQSLTSGMELRDNILVSGNADSTVKVWDITTGQCLQTLSGPNKHQSAVTCLQFNSKFVVTSSDDGTVKLWDVRTGEFLRDLVALESGGSGGVVWRIRANATKLVCAVGSRNGTEETKLLVLDFDVPDAK